MTTAVAACPVPILQFFGNDGRPLAGGSILTQVGGVNAVTYADSAGTVPLPNPIPLNSRGEVSNASGQSSQLFLPINTVYTFTFSDAGGIQVWVATYVDGIQQTQASLGQLFYPQTLAEAAAGVTPTNYWYPPGSVDRYGTNTTPGTTPMTTAFQSAVSQCKQLGGSEVTFGLTGLYLLTAPIDCTFTGTGNQQGIMIRGIAGSSQDQGHGIIVNHTGNSIFDCTGCDRFVMENCFISSQINVAAGSCPKMGILWARNASQASGSGFNRLRNVTMSGSYSIACLYNYSNETNLIEGCYFYNSCTSAGTATRIYTGTNIKNVTALIPIFSGAVSNTAHTSIGCEDLNTAGTTTSDCIYLETVDGWSSYGGWAFSGNGTSGGRALIFIDQSVSASAHIQIYGFKGEASAGVLQSYGVLQSNDARTLTGLVVDGCYLPNSNFAIAVGQGSTGAILDGSVIRGVSEQASHGVSAPGTIQNCFLHLGAMKLAVGISLRNVLMGLSENWTIITSRSQDFWIDQGATNKGWVPNTSALTGTISVTNAECCAFGSMVKVSLQIHASTGTLSCAAGTAITGLPFPVVGKTAVVNVVNSDTPVAIGQGVATGSSLILPAISATSNNIAIDCTYFAA